MIPELHPFQLDLVERVRHARAAGKRIIVLQGATGCGKNTIAAFIMRAASQKASDTLAIVHRRKLVDQISDRLIQFETQHSILMRGERFDRQGFVTVASRDTLLSRCVNNGWIGLPPASLVIVDEAHHAASLESEYRRILAQYPHATILLITATPVGPDGKGLGPWAQHIECAAPTSQLVRDGYLVPVKVFAPERKRRGKKYVRGIAGNLVQSWKNFAENKPTVLFCSRVKHSQDAVAAFAEEGISASHVDADTSDGERDAVFENLADGKIKVVSNVGIIGEGVDVPELGCCQIFCEMGGRVRFLQACGRIMRPFSGKTHGILIDHAGAVFQHGFPDEDTEWTLEGNADETFKKKHKAGETEKALYCKHCERAYHGCESCPTCGRKPVKPPRSVFAPPELRPRNELLTEAERNGEQGEWSQDQKQKHWLRCLGLAAAKNGNFKMASAIYKRKYNEWPADTFPCLPPWKERDMRVADKYPNFRRRKTV